MPPRFALVLLGCLCVATALAAQSVAPVQSSDLALQIAAIIAAPAVSRTHWGVMVTTMEGVPIYALNEGQLFQPASNTKLFTTAAALALIPSMTLETRVVGRGRFDGAGTLDGDLVLIGDGDANLSGRMVPYAPAAKAEPGLRYLEAMADAVAQSGLNRVNGDVVGDDTLFPWEPYAADWAIDDAVWGYGAPVSALTVNDNEIEVTVRPMSQSREMGQPQPMSQNRDMGYPGAAEVTLDPDVGYYTVDASGLKTVAAKGVSRVEMARAMGSRVLRVYGTIAADAKPDREEIAIEDPAEFAAMAMKRMLEARGVSVSGAARAEHRMAADAAGFLAETREPISGLRISPNAGYGRGSGLTSYSCDHCDPRTLPEEKLLASHESPTVAEDVVITNKESQNLHAELLLRQLGAAVGTDGSIAQGARVVRSFLVNAGVDPGEFVFFDGSGMSGHNLVTPRVITKLLQFASTQPWFAAYKASLPVGGVDGSLESRFTKAPLKGHVFAKTGTNSETRALSGYLECASGRTVIFSILAGDHFPSTSADREAMDRIVAAIADAD